MTIDIDAIEARANAATPGPWESTHGITYDPDAGLIEDREFMIMRADDDTAIASDVFDPVIQKPSAANCEFIAAARQDVPALCAEVRELRALVTAHNERVAAACKWRQENGHCDYAKRGDLCPDCPQEWEIGND